ncbi:MAG: nucleotidyltransferase domain-containing protein [Spirochaetia bacterium]
MSARATEPEIQTEIEKLVRRIVSQARPLRIILFGSFARGDFNTSSDLDLCIIVSDAEEWFERSRRFRALTRLPEMDVEPHVYTAEEFAGMIERENPLALRIMTEGKVLYEQQ